MKPFNTITGVLIVSSIFNVSSPVLAVTKTAPAVMMEKIATAPAEVVNKVEYSLPYPGILPDHPLFLIKKFRDALMEKLIADPVRKTEFYVLQADKNINMGIFLVAKQKESLAIETMTLGEKRMEMALTTALALKESGKEVPAYLIEKLTNALDKHEEVVNDMVRGSSNTQYQLIQELINKLQEDVAKLKG